MLDPVTTFFVLLLFASVATWMLVWRKRWALPFEPRRAVPWGLVDLIAVMVLMAMLQTMALQWMSSRGWIDAGQPAAETLSASQQIRIILIGSLSQVGALAIWVVVTMLLRPYVTLADFGFSRRQLLSDMRLGAFAFLLMVPPTYLVQTILVQFVESKHPLIDLLRNNPSATFLVVSGLSAVVIAPVVEELLFRVLLQGWLERAALFHDDPIALFVGGRRLSVSNGTTEDQKQNSPSVADPPATPDGAGATAPQFNPYQTPQSATASLEGLTDAVMTVKPVYWYLPILISALFFALMHMSHGPDWVPLFLLAVGLGYLYQRTHRIVPSMIVHFLLNLCTLAALSYELYR